MKLFYARKWHSTFKHDMDFSLKILLLYSLGSCVCCKCCNKIVLHVNAASIQKFCSDKNMLCSSLYYFKNTYTKQSETGPFQCDGKDLYSLSSYINLKIKLFNLFCSSSFLIYLSQYGSFLSTTLP